MNSFSGKAHIESECLAFTMEDLIVNDLISIEFGSQAGQLYLFNSCIKEYHWSFLGRIWHWEIYAWQYLQPLKLYFFQLKWVERYIITPGKCLFRNWKWKCFQSCANTMLTKHLSCSWTIGIHQAIVLQKLYLTVAYSIWMCFFTRIIDMVFVDCHSN